MLPLVIHFFHVIQIFALKLIRTTRQHNAEAIFNSQSWSASPRRIIHRQPDPGLVRPFGSSFRLTSAQVPKPIDLRREESRPSGDRRREKKANLESLILITASVRGPSWIVAVRKRRYPGWACPFSFPLTVGSTGIGRGRLSRPKWLSLNKWSGIFWPSFVLAPLTGSLSLVCASSSSL